jgi:hypothetical protein
LDRLRELTHREDAKHAEMAYRIQFRMPPAKEVEEALEKIERSVSPTIVGAKLRSGRVYPRTAVSGVFYDRANCETDLVKHFGRYFPDFADEALIVKPSKLQRVDSGRL